MLAIINGKVLTITNGTLDPGTVLIDNGKIVAVGANIPIPAGAEVYDAAGKYVTPGLIDAHCHVGLFPDGIGWDHSDGNECTDRSRRRCGPSTPSIRRTWPGRSCWRTA